MVVTLYSHNLSTVRKTQLMWTFHEPGAGTALMWPIIAPERDLDSLGLQGSEIRITTSILKRSIRLFPLAEVSPYPPATWRMIVRQGNNYLRPSSLNGTQGTQLSI